jgi:hypothetical protein
MTETYKGKTIRIEQDEDARSPQEDGDDALCLIGDHRQFYVGPPGTTRNGKGRNFDVQEEIESRKETHHVFMLEAYIHSGVVLALAREGNFPDRQWDVSLLGAVFVSKTEWPDAQKAREAALSLVSVWNQYLSGDVWGFTIEDSDESCWGFYGEDYCLSEAKSIVDYIVERERKEKQAKLKAVILHHVPLTYRVAALA